MHPIEGGDSQDSKDVQQPPSEPSPVPPIQGDRKGLSKLLQVSNSSIPPPIPYPASARPPSELPHPRLEGLVDGKGVDTWSASQQAYRDEGLVAVCRLYCNKRPMHETPISTHTPSTQCVLDDGKLAPVITWHDTLHFPVRYRDLCRDAEIEILFQNIVGPVMGGGRIPLFDGNGALRQGRQKIPVFWSPSSENKNSPPFDQGGMRMNPPPPPVSPCESSDFAFQSEKKLEAHALGLMQQSEWLDDISLPRVQDVLSHLLCVDTRSVCHPHTSDFEWGLYQSTFLVVDLPCFDFTVVYEERAYPSSMTGVGGGGGVVELGLGQIEWTDGLSALKSTASTSPSRTVGGIATIPIKINEGEGEGKDGDLNKSGGAEWWPLPVVMDWEVEEDNPVELKYRKLAHSLLRGASDPNLKPNRDERQLIDAIINSPALGDHLRMEEKDLLWKFRHALTDNPKALTKFLLSVDWALESEVAQVPELLDQWKLRTPVDVTDALKLLGRERAFQSDVVRAFAIDALGRATDKQLLPFLLQLVQALRYSSPEPDISETADLDSIERKGSTSASYISLAPPSPNCVVTPTISPLAILLISRACGSLEFASFLYWYLCVELDDPTHGAVFRAVFQAFGIAMSQNEESMEIMALLKQQEAYVQAITAVHQTAAATRGRKPQKEAHLYQLLQDPALRRITGGGIPLPLDPRVFVEGLRPESSFMFKSALYPCVIDFVTRGSLEKPSQEVDGDDVSPVMADGKKINKIGGALPPPPSPTTLKSTAAGSYKVIFKTGDDLRQDQLIIQMISLMDGLLKQVNLDLKLRTYRILATGPRDGLVEFVECSFPISEVLKDFGNSILEFLKAHNPDKNSHLGVKRRAMSNFVRSTAGYCVITYLLGIGDRHFDNLMIQPEGNLFHIDFGYILGADPKPLAPPPFRFSKEMMEAMGGVDSPDYKRFRMYCCQAYTILRKRAQLILNLLNLMVDAGIEELSNDPRGTLSGVEEKFRLDLTDEQAENFFLSLIDDSLNAIGPIVLEKMHQFAVARR